MRMFFSAIGTLFAIAAIYSNWALGQVDWTNIGYLYWMPWGTGILSWSVPLVLAVLSTLCFTYGAGYQNVPKGHVGDAVEH